MEDVKEPIVVLMAGLPCAGKTTIACGLERELGWRVIDKDRYRLGLLEQGMDDDGAAKEAYERSFDDIRKALKQQVSVIFDTAALYRFIVDAVKEIVDSVEGARLKVILCVVDRDLRNDRLRIRPFQSTRITVDPATIPDYLHHFEHLPQDKLTLFTHEPFQECLSEARTYVTS
jgi:predicted kinase